MGKIAISLHYSTFISLLLLSFYLSARERERKRAIRQLRQIRKQNRPTGTRTYHSLVSRRSGEIIRILPRWFRESDWTNECCWPRQREREKERDRGRRILLIRPARVRSSHVPHIDSAYHILNWGGQHFQHPIKPSSSSRCCRYPTAESPQSIYFAVKSPMEFQAE